MRIGGLRPPEPAGSRRRGSSSSRRVRPAAPCPRRSADLPSRTSSRPGLPMRARGRHRSRRSSPRSNGVPRIDGSISDQSRFEAASTVSMSACSSGNAASSSNRPPLNQSTVSKPTGRREPSHRRDARQVRKLRGVRRACSSIRVNMWPGSRADVVGEHAEGEPVTKCATACGSWPRSRSACATAANDSAARSVSTCRVSPGCSRSGPENAHLSRSRVAALARSSRPNS